MERRADYRGVGLAVTEALQKQGITPVPLAYTSDAEGFYQAIGKAKQNNMHGAFVTQHEVSEYANDALFLSADGNTGVAVTPDGDIVSVFKNPQSKAKKAVSSILLTALENGGVKLDNFNGGLSRMYWNHGFIPVARAAFDPEFAPSDWNYARDGQPDIIFWVHNGEDAQTVARRIGERGDLPDLTKLPVMSYDEAAAYRDTIIKQGADTGEAGSAFFNAPQTQDTPLETVYEASGRNAQANQNRTESLFDPALLEIVDRVADRTGRDIRIVEALGDGIDGKYDSETGTLYIAADSQNPVLAILKHELTHSLEGTAAYKELSDFITSSFIQEDAQALGVSVAELAEAKRRQYAQAGYELSYEGAMQELVADYCGAKLFTDEASIRRLSAEKPSLARRILNWIRSMKTKLFGTQQEKMLARAEQMYHDALMEPFVKRDGVQYKLNPSFQSEYDAWVTGGKKNGGYFRLGTTSKALESIEINPANIYWDKSKINTIQKNHPEMTDAVIKSVPQMLEDPMLVMQSLTVPNRVVVFGDLIADNGKPVLTALELRPNGEIENIIKVASSYSKDAQHLIDNSDILYVHPDKNRTDSWLEARRLQLPVGLTNYGSIGRVTYTNRNVNGEVQFDGSTPQKTAMQLAFETAMENSTNTSISGNPARDTVKYALRTREVNSDGQALTDGQARYFAKSRARDSDGQLLVVYHATDAEFTVFDKARQGSANDPGVWGSGFYFDTDQEFAEEFGSKSKPYYLNITHPLRTTYDANCWPVADMFRRAGIDIPFKVKDDMSLLQFIKKFGNQKFSEALRRLGFDGVIVSGEECVIYEPEQAKLISNESPTADPDMRYAIGYMDTDTKASMRQLVERYGAIPQGEAPARDVAVPKQTSDGTRVRQFARTAAESAQVPDRFLRGMTEDILDDVYSYVPISNQDAMRRAVSTVETFGLDNAVKQWDAVVNGTHLPGKYDVALGEYLLTIAGKNRDSALASKMIIELSVVGTQAGQAVQAMSMLKRMTPEGQLMALQRIAESVNRKHSDNQVKIPEEIVERMQRVNPRDTGTIQRIFKDGLVSIAEQTPSTLLDKWNAWRYLAMLGNPRTHIRNMAGNAVFAPVVYTKNALAGAIEGVWDAASRAKSGKGIERTKTALSALPFSKRAEYLDFVRQDYQEMKDVIHGGGGKNPADVIRDNQKIFTSKRMQLVEKAGTLNSTMLEKEDLAFKRLHYERALMQYLAANKIDLAHLDKETLNRGRNYAIREAQKATFADASALANALNRLSRQHKGAQFVVEGLLPFKKTPINILKRGVEYSPIGMLDTLTRKAYQLKKGRISAAEFIDGLSAGLTGVGVMALGMWLNSLGLLSGGMGYDDEDQFERLQGGQEYALQLGDTSYTLDWAAPATLPLFVGAEIAQFYRDSKEGEISFSKCLEALINLSEPLVNMSMLQGIDDAIQNVKFSDNPLSDFAINAAAGYVSQGVPTLSGQIARTLDDRRRRNYVEPGSAFPSIQTALQKNKSKVPGALQTQQPYVDSWGREEPGGNIAERAFSNFISPGYTGRKQTSDMEKELQRLYEETGESGVLPSPAGKSVTSGGNRYNLTAEEYTAYQRAVGRTAYDRLNELTGTAAYLALTDEQRAEAVSTVYDYAKDFAKEQVLRSRGEEYAASSERQKIDAAERNGIPLSVYLSYIVRAKALRADKKENGDTINGSLKRKKEKILKEMGINDQQKAVLLALNGYGSTQQRESILDGDFSLSQNSSSYPETDIDRLLKGALS